MIVIGKFSELNQNINKILDKLVQSQNLCKYLYYNSDDPISETDINDVTELLYTNIYPYPTPTSVFVDSDGTPIASTVINVIFDDFKLTDKNNKFKVGELAFIVICHTSLWRLDTSELRPFCILNELDEMFSEGRVIGIGKSEFKRCHLVGGDDNYMGYRIAYKDYEFA